MRERSKGGALRRATKNPGLVNSMHPRSRREYLDGDYYDKLNDEQKAMLSKFLDEYYGGALAKADEPESWENDLHSTEAERKSCWDRTNARNRDLFSLLLQGKALEEITERTSEDSSFYVQGNMQEDNLIAILDAKDASYDIRTKKRGRPAKNKANTED